MAGKTRVIDAQTKDYVTNDAGNGTKTTRNASTAIYHQIKTQLGEWWGDPTAGSRMFELDRAKNALASPLVIQDIWSEALQPLINDGRITVPVFETERLTDRVNIEVTSTDLQSGEQLELTDLLPFDI